MRSSSLEIVISETHVYFFIITIETDVCYFVLIDIIFNDNTTRSHSEGMILNHILGQLYGLICKMQRELIQNGLALLF